uniref:Variant surface glycoprotein 1125.5473 n=1 Tax=Trypanosoma brucei TaxID=5691 RepID=A0A1J0RCP5_9TRYP|nr:variant surface glycoprotein 1125.5473 [Trypanosoma brucei]
MFVTVTLAVMLLIEGWRLTQSARQSKGNTAMQGGLTTRLSTQNSVKKSRTNQKIQASASNSAYLARQAAAATEDTNTSLVLMAAALAADKCAESAAAAYSNFLSTAAPALINAPKAAEKISKLANLLRKAAKGSTSAATAAASIEALQRPPEYDGQPSDIVEIDTTVITDYGYAQIGGTAAHDGGSAASKCGFLISGEAATKLWTTTNPSGVNVMAVFLKLTARDNQGAEAAAMPKPDSGAVNRRFNDRRDTPKNIYNDIQTLREFSLPDSGQTVGDAVAKAIYKKATQTLLTQVLATQEP